MVTKKQTEPRTGRFPSLTPQVFRALAEATANGLPRKAAAQCAGIAGCTFLKYLRNGRAQHGDRLPPAIFKKWMEGQHTLTLPQRKQMLGDFVHTLQKSRGAAIKRNVEVIQAAALGRQVVERRTITHPNGDVETVERYAPGQWTAAAWWLERCEPDDFGRRDHTTTTVKTADGQRGAAILIVDGPEKVTPPTE